MLGAPPAFILSQDRTLRSDARRSSRRSHRACSGRPCPAPNPADSDSRKNELTCACCHTSSKFRLLSRRRSHRSQYPVLRVRRGGWARRARNNYMLPKPFWVPECGRTHLLHILPGGRRAPRRKGPGGSPGPSRTASTDENAPRWSATSCSPTDSLRSTIGARGLNFRVRNGTGCASPAMVADQRGAFCCQGAGLPPCPQGRTARLPTTSLSRCRRPNV